MAGNQKNNPKADLTFFMPKDPFFTSIQLAMLVGKTFEALAVTQVRQVVEGSHRQTVKLLEGVDTNIGRLSKSAGGSLCFPFDVMDHATQTVTDNWCALMGLETAREAKMSELLEAKEKLLLEREKELQHEISVQSQRVSSRDKQLAVQQGETEKAQKAKLSAQRAQRKLKAELEASSGKLQELKEEASAANERYDHQLSENKRLKNQKQEAELELAKARQEAEGLKSDTGQMVSQIEAMAAKQEILIAEKDGLNKRIEELQHQLEQSSHYTE